MPCFGANGHADHSCVTPHAPTVLGANTTREHVERTVDEQAGRVGRFLTCFCGVFGSSDASDYKENGSIKNTFFLVCMTKEPDAS